MNLKINSKKLILLTVWTLFILLIGYILGFNNAESIYKGSRAIPTPYNQPMSISDVLSPTRVQESEKVAKFSKSQVQEQDDLQYGETIKIDEDTSVSRFAEDDHMSTEPELHQAINSYRSVRGLSILDTHPTLCNIAQTRANQLLAAGELDYHAGFYDLADTQTDFNNVSEVLFGGVQKVSGVHIVEWGWDKSLTGHNEAISNPKWQKGCAGIAGLFAVYIFGTN